jgi:hypothetical protein
VKERPRGRRKGRSQDEEEGLRRRWLKERKGRSLDERRGGPKEEGEEPRGVDLRTGRKGRG